MKMKKNKLINLNDHLFEQLERLNDDELKGDALVQEGRRAEFMCTLAERIIDNAALALKASTAINDGLVNSAPAMLGIERSQALEDKTHG